MIQGCSLSLLSVIARLPRKHLGTTLSISGLKWMFIVRHVFSQSADLAVLVNGRYCKSNPPLSYNQSLKKTQQEYCLEVKAWIKTVHKTLPPAL